MITIKNDLNSLKDEIENLLNFEISIENESITLEGSFNNMQLITSLKASLMIMLYNAVESTITKCLTKIHERINISHLKYSDLTDSLKKLYLTYYSRAIKKSNPENEVNFEFQLINLIKDLDDINLSFEMITKSYNLYSGNLDSKEIMTVLRRYGLELELKESSLQTIKKDRNILAHGEKSFEEIGRELSYQQIQDIKDKTFTYLETFIQEIENYINNNKYKVS